MKIRVQDSADLDGLIAFLKERDYVAEQVGPNTIEVSRLSSVRHDHVRVELDLFLSAWHTAHPEARPSSSNRPRTVLAPPIARASATGLARAGARTASLPRPSLARGIRG